MLSHTMLFNFSENCWILPLGLNHFTLLSTATGMFQFFHTLQHLLLSVFSVRKLSHWMLSHRCKLSARTSCHISRRHLLNICWRNGVVCCPFMRAFTNDEAHIMPWSERVEIWIPILDLTKNKGQRTKKILDLWSLSPHPVLSTVRRGFSVPLLNATLMFREEC